MTEGTNPELPIAGTYPGRRQQDFVLLPGATLPILGITPQKNLITFEKVKCEDETEISLGDESFTLQHDCKGNWRVILWFVNATAQ